MVILVVVLFLAWAFGPLVKEAVLYGLSLVGVTVLKGAQVLVFAKPRPDSPANVFTFTGLDVGHRFFGIVTSQEAHLAPAEQPKQSRIVVPD
jgi:hypothetical protein